jgi:NADH-quinone oxidoreductase subunit M
MLMIFLTNILILISFILSIGKIKIRPNSYVASFLMLQSFIIAAFSSLNLILFYIFFEAILIPMFLIIGIWGGKDRIYSSIKFFLYTLVGSLFFLISIIYIISQYNSAEITELRGILPMVDLEIQKWLWLGFFLSFAVKIPIPPFHTWLPSAHVQAPTSGSVILAAILIKLGSYGFLRLSLPMLPDASAYFATFMSWLGVVAIIYASLIAYVQKDIKKMIAYSSVAHMGFVVIGIFSLNNQGLDGAIFQLFSHGLISAALFISIGVIYERTGSREIKIYGGVAHKMPKYALMMMIFTMGSVGLPGTSGFVGEFLAILGSFKYNKIIATCAAIGVILGAVYMLHLYKSVLLGEVKSEKISLLKDLSKIEFIILAFLAFLVILLGIFPNLILDYTANVSKVILLSL